MCYKPVIQVFKVPKLHVLHAPCYTKMVDQFKLSKVRVVKENIDQLKNANKPSSNIFITAKSYLSICQFFLTSRLPQLIEIHLCMLSAFHCRIKDVFYWSWVIQ